MKDNNLHISAALLATAIFLFLILFSCVGPRGSDQFWYLYDMKSLVEGGGNISNTYWAGSFWRNPTSQADNFFLHNNLLIYLVLPAAKVLGAFGGWILITAAASITAALCVGYSVKIICSDRKWAYISYSLYLLLPLTFWLGSNMLQEGMMAAWFAFCFLTLTLGQTRGSVLWWLITILLLLTGVWIHPFFTAGALAATGAFMIWGPKKCSWRLRASIGVFFILSVWVMNYLKGIIFPSTSMPGLIAIIQEYIPGRSNSAWHEYFDPIPVTAGLIFEKAKIACIEQLGLSKEAIFRWPSNVAILMCMYGLFSKCENDKRRVYVICFAAMGIYSSLVVLHQNQFRYIIIIMPALVAGVCLVLHKSNRSHFYRIACGVAILLFSLVDLNCAAKMRAEAFQIKEKLSIWQNHASLIKGPCIINTVNQQEIYSARPHPVMVFQKTLAGDPRSKELFARFAPKHLLTQEPESLQWLDKLDWKAIGSHAVGNIGWYIVDIVQ